MTTQGRSIVARAERNLARLRQLREIQQDQEWQSRARTVATRAAEARAGLEAFRKVTPVLADSGIRTSEVPPHLAKSAQRARTTLRQTATAVLRGEESGRGERLSAPSVQVALEHAERLKRQKEVDLNKAVDAWRRDALPPDITTNLIDLPGLSPAVPLRLKRIATLLQRPIGGLSPAELPGKVDELRAALTEWQRDKAEYDAALEREDPEIKTFLTQAASEEGADWSMVTPAVREWLDAGDTVVRIRLR